jgi:hypothetical protein
VDVNVLHSFVMRRRMVFCEIIRQILKARAPIYIKLALFHPIFDQIKLHIHGFCAFRFIVPLLYPVAVLLSVSICLGGCLCPNSSNVFLRTFPSYAFIKTAPISASAAEDMTCLRTLLIIKISLFVSFFDVLLRFPCKRIPQPCFLLIF